MASESFLSAPRRPAPGQQGRSLPRVDDSALWAAFVGARSASDFCKSWLSIQCGMIAGAKTALLLLEEDDGRFAVAAVWPDPTRDATYLGPAAEQALTERRGVVRKPEPGKGDPDGSHVAYPIDIGGKLYGVVVAHVATENPGELQAILRQFLWGVGWLESMFRRHQTERDQALIERTTFAMDMLAGASEHRQFKASALDVANELAARLNCRRVSIGLARKDDLHLAAISHSAVVKEKSHVVATLLNAMDEAYDQQTSVSFPATETTERAINLAHRDLARLSGANAVASVVMASAGRRVGVVTLERDGAEIFDQRSIQLLEAVAALLGPLLEMKAETQRLIAGRVVDKTGEGLRALFGPRRPALKLAALAIAAGLTTMAFVAGEFRVSARAVVEGSMQRAAVAPFEGFLATAPARAGDVVEEGQVLATLDDRELQLEAVRWKSDLEQQRLKYNDALGKHDRPAARVYQAQIEQSAAQLAQVEDRLARAKIRAPFRGVVVSGDLSQSLGSPVEKGKTLFELAPLDAYRVILQVDERDITHVEKGQRGQLVLTSLANAAFPFTVKTVTPVATATDGRNHFRAEADVESEGVQLRPGMEGVGKVSVGERRLLWIWTRPLIDWARLTLWKYWP